jgi:hypothetical protein
MAITISGSGITSANIADDTIVNSDINSSAAIASSKLSGTGKVLQVVHSTLRTAVDDTTTTTYAEIHTQYRVTITPTSSSSTIWLQFQGQFGLQSDVQQGMRFMRSTDSGSNWTSIHPATSQGETHRNSGSGYLQQSATLSFLDSPNTTSSVMYTMYFNRHAGSSTCRVNDNGMGSRLTAMEIAG